MLSLHSEESLALSAETKNAPQRLDELAKDVPKTELGRPGLR